MSIGKFELTAEIVGIVFLFGDAVYDTVHFDRNNTERFHRLGTDAYSDVFLVVAFELHRERTVVIEIGLAEESFGIITDVEVQYLCHLVGELHRMDDVELIVESTLVITVVETEIFGNVHCAALILSQSNLDIGNALILGLQGTDIDECYQKRQNTAHQQPIPVIDDHRQIVLDIECRVRPFLGFCCLLSRRGLEACLRDGFHILHEGMYCLVRMRP